MSPTIQLHAESQRVEELRKLLQQAGYAYYVLDSPIMEDTIYDRLYRELQELEKKISKPGY